MYYFSAAFEENVKGHELKKFLIWIGMAGVVRAEPEWGQTEKGLFQQVLVEWQFFSMFSILSFLHRPFELKF